MLSMGNTGLARAAQVEMVELALELVAVTWRLRGCGLYTLNGGWEGLALGVVEGEWDGTATSSR